MKSLPILRQDTSVKLEKLIPTLGKFHKTEQIISQNNHEPSLQQLETSCGEGEMKILLLRAIAYMEEIIGAVLSENQIDYIMNYILTFYKSYTLSDFNIVTKNITMKPSFGKPRVQTIISAISDYSDERDEACVNYQIKKSSMYKSEDFSHEKILEEYKRLKAEAKQPKKSDKEIAAKNKSDNDEKVHILKERFPDQFPQDEKQNCI